MKAHSLYHPEGMSSIFLASAERTPNFCDILSSSVSVYSIPVLKKLQLLLLSPETSYLEQSKSVNRLEVGTMWSWNNF